MQTSADTIALIPARAGSEGVPRKNQLDLCGVPLVGHSLAFANSVSRIAEVFLSTDNAEIAEVGRSFGASIPFLRPSELAASNSPTAATVRHFIGQQRKELVGGVKYLALLEPTSPIRSVPLLDAAIEALDDNPTWDGVVSVDQPALSPLWVGVQIDAEGRLTRHPLLRNETVSRRQDATPYYRVNGNFFVWRLNYAAALPDAWLHAGKFGGFKIPQELAYTIDTPTDFAVVRAIMEAGLVELPWLIESS